VAPLWRLGPVTAGAAGWAGVPGRGRV